MNSDELRQQAADLALEVDRLSSLEKPTEEDTAALEARMAEVDELVERVNETVAAEERAAAREKKMDEIRAFAAKPSHVVSGDGARVSPVVGASTRNIWDKDEARMASDSPRAYAAELRSRAATAIEQSDAPDSIHGLSSDEFREQATRRLEKALEQGDDQHDAVANRWIDFGNPEYRDNWKRAMRGDRGAQAWCQSKTIDHETRAAWAVDGTTTTGGYAVVPDYDVTLLLINAGTNNPWRQLADVRTTNVNKVYGLSTAGMSVGYITESVEEGDDTPTVAQPSWNIERASGYIQASFETVADTNLGNEVAMLFNDAKDVLESTKFATGTGGGEPWGVINRCANLGALVFGDSGSTVEQSLQVGDIYALSNALDPRWQGNANFVASRTIYNEIRRLNNSSSPGATFWVDFGGGIPAQLIGYPTHISSAMDTTTVSGSLDYLVVLGDFRAGYRIYDRIGTTVAFNPLVIGSNRRPTGEVGWFFYWRNTADVVDQTSASHFKLLRK